MTAPIVILSDYGMGAGTAAVKGVCKTFAPQSHVYELSRDIPALNLDAAADVLCAGMQAWPEGTVFLNLVDNGEKGRRQAVVATKDGYIVVSPDNKVLAAVEAAHGAAEKRGVRRRIRKDCAVPRARSGLRCGQGCGEGTVSKKPCASY